MFVDMFGPFARLDDSIGFYTVLYHAAPRRDTCWTLTCCGPDRRRRCTTRARATDDHYDYDGGGWREEEKRTEISTFVRGLGRGEGRTAWLTTVSGTVHWRYWLAGWLTGRPADRLAGARRIRHTNKLPCGASGGSGLSGGSSRRIFVLIRRPRSAAHGVPKRRYSRSKLISPQQIDRFGFEGFYFPPRKYGNNVLRDTQMIAAQYNNNYTVI